MRSVYQQMASSAMTAASSGGVARGGSGAQSRRGENIFGGRKLA